MTAAPFCRCCGRERKRRADGRGWAGYHGYCPACAERWRVAGRPPGGPPAAPGHAGRAVRISAGLRRHHAAHGQSEAALAALAAGRVVGWRNGPAASARKAEWRRQDYAWLRSFGEPREQAAARAGVSVRHARYVYEPGIAAMETAQGRMR